MVATDDVSIMMKLKHSWRRVDFTYQDKNILHAPDDSFFHGCDYLNIFSSYTFGLNPTFWPFYINVFL